MSNTTINTENYEEFALDYLEGNLSENQRTEFDAFLSQNPAIAEELTDLLDFSLANQSLTFGEKQSLKKPVPSSNGRRYILLSIAASVLLAVTAIAFLSQDGGDRSDNIANENQEVIDKTPESNIQTIDKIQEKNQKSNQQMDIDDEASARIVNEEIVPVQPKTNKSVKPEASSNQQVNQVVQETKQIKNKSAVNEKIDFVNQQDLLHPQEKIKSQSPTQGPVINVTEDKNTPIIAAVEPQEEVGNSSVTNGIDKRIENEINPNNIVLDNNEIEVASENINQGLTDQKREVTTIAELPIAASTLATETEAVVAANLSNLPDITIHIDDQPVDEDIIASVDKNVKRKNSIFKNFIPESFAGLTKEDIKQSLIPEGFISK